MSGPSSPEAKRVKLNDESDLPSQEKENTTSDDVIFIDEDDKIPVTPGTKRKRESMMEQKKKEKEEEKKRKLEEKEKLKREKEEARLKAEKIKQEERERKEQQKRLKEAQKEQEEAERKERRRQEEEAARQRREEIQKMKAEAVARRIAEQEERRKRKLAEEEEKLRKKQEKEEVRKQQEEKKRQIELKKKEIEEKKRQEEEKRRKQEEERDRQLKRQSAFLMSFVQKEEKSKPKFLKAPKDHWLFSDFEIKEGMTLAPIHGREVLTPQEQTNLLTITVEKSDYLQKLPERPVTKIRPMKAKYYHFHSDYRPPWYGTWRKKSKKITGRRPFAADNDLLDYEYDSEAEWEAPEGDDVDECLSDEEEEVDPEDNSDEEDGFLVEHGYLSNDEGEDAECERPPGETEEERKQRLKEKDREWKDQQKLKQSRHKMKQLIPNEVFSFDYDSIRECYRQHMQPGIYLVYDD